MINTDIIYRLAQKYQIKKRVSREAGVESKWPEFAVRLVGLHLAKTHNFRGSCPLE